jgi:phage portal protein BeeE
MAFEFSFKFGKQNKSSAPAPATRTAAATQQIISTSDFTPIQAALSIFGGNAWDAIRFMYENIPEFAAPINMIIEKSVEVPHLYQELRGKEFQYLPDPYAELWQQPNQFQEEMDFYKMAMLYKFVYGEQIINMDYPVGMRKYIDKLFLLPPNECIINFTNNFDDDWRKKQFESIWWKTKTILPESFIYRKDINALTSPDKRGVSRLNCLRNTGKELQAITEAGIKTIEDRGSMGLIFPESNGAFAEGDDETIRKAFYEKIGITGDKFPFLITSRPLQYVATGMNVQELGLDAARLKDFRNICMVMKAPSQLFNDVVNSTYNNIATIRKTFYENAIIPEVNDLCRVKGKVVGLKTNARYIPDFSQVSALQEDAKAISDIAIAQYNAGLITGDEAREVISYDAMNLGLKTESNGTNSGANQSN